MRTAVIYNFLIEANLMAAIAILLMIPVRLLGRQKLGNRVICFAWLLVAIRLLCPLALPNPVIHEIRSAFSQDEAIRPIAGQIQVRFGDAMDALYDGARFAQRGGEMEENLQELRDDARNGMLSIRLMKVYLAGLGAVSGWFVFSNWRFRRQLRADRIEPISGRPLDEYQALCEELGLKPIPVFFVDPLPSACLVGCLKPYIALPLTARPQEIAPILRHELCHYRAKDHWWSLVRLLCCAVHWFNPLVWIAARMCCTDTELACDERVIQSMDKEQKHAYASVLVLAASRRDLPGVAVMSTGMSMTGRRLKKRVLSIVSDAKAHKGLALCFALAASMALIGAFATAEAPFLPRVPSTPMRYEPEMVTAVSEEEKARVIELGKQFWSNEALKADVHDKLEWSVYALEQHTEVWAHDPAWGDALILALSPEGKVLYMNNRRSADREATSGIQAAYRLSKLELDKVKEYGLSVLYAMDPTLQGKLDDMEHGSGSSIGENCFYRFFAYTGEGKERRMSHVFNVQVRPEVRLTHYENLLELNEEASDRLEPGNG